MCRRDRLKNIGIVRLSAMGDVILSVPMVRTLQARYPDAKITWITSPSAYAILKDLSGVDFVIVNKPNNLREYWNIYQKLKPYYFDVLLCMQASFRANLLYPLIKSRQRIGFDKARARDAHRFFLYAFAKNCTPVPAGRDHLLDAFMRFAEAVDCHEKKYEWNLAIAEEDKKWAEDHLHFSSSAKKIIAINPLASKQERCWFKDRYIEVVQLAKQYWDVNIILTGGPSTEEINLAEAIEHAFPKESFLKNLVGKTTPKQLAALLEKVDVLVSPDTGPLHLATAVGTPVVGLYAVASSGLSGPYFSKELTIDKFPEAVRTFLKKDPHQVPWKTRVHTQAAMSLIQVEEVMEKLEKVLGHRIT